MDLLKIWQTARPPRPQQDAARVAAKTDSEDYRGIVARTSTVLIENPNSVNSENEKSKSSSSSVKKKPALGKRQKSAGVAELSAPLNKRSKPAEVKKLETSESASGSQDESPVSVSLIDARDQEVPMNMSPQRDGAPATTTTTTSSVSVRSPSTSGNTCNDVRSSDAALSTSVLSSCSPARPSSVTSNSPVVSQSSVLPKSTKSSGRSDCLSSTVPSASVSVASPQVQLTDTQPVSVPISLSQSHPPTALSTSVSSPVSSIRSSAVTLPSSCTAAPNPSGFPLASVTTSASGQNPSGCDGVVPSTRPTVGHSRVQTVAASPASTSAGQTPPPRAVGQPAAVSLGQFPFRFALPQPASATLGRLPMRLPAPESGAYLMPFQLMPPPAVLQALGRLAAPVTAGQLPFQSARVPFGYQFFPAPVLPPVPVPVANVGAEQSDGGNEKFPLRSPPAVTRLIPTDLRVRAETTSVSKATTVPLRSPSGDTVSMEHSLSASAAGVGADTSSSSSASEVTGLSSRTSSQCQTTRSAVHSSHAAASATCSSASSSEADVPTQVLVLRPSQSTRHASSTCAVTQSLCSPKSSVPRRLSSSSSSATSAAGSSHDGAVPDVPMRPGEHPTGAGRVARSVPVGLPLNAVQPPSGGPIRIRLDASRFDTGSGPNALATRIQDLLAQTGSVRPGTSIRIRFMTTQGQSNNVSSNPAISASCIQMPQPMNLTTASSRLRDVCTGGEPPQVTPHVERTLSALKPVAGDDSRQAEKRCQAPAETFSSGTSSAIAHMTSPSAHVSSAVVEKRDSAAVAGKKDVKNVGEAAGERIAQLDGAADDDVTTSANSGTSVETAAAPERELVDLESPTSRARRRSRRASEQGQGHEDTPTKTRYAEWSCLL